MSYCPHCGIQHGMAPGTGDCGCEDSFDVGFQLASPEDQARSRAMTEAWWNNYSSSDRVRVEIMLEGPGLKGLNTAESFLMMAGFPPEEGGPKEGRYEDKSLLVRCSWKMVEADNTPIQEVRVCNWCGCKEPFKDNHEPWCPSYGRADDECH